MTRPSLLHTALSHLTLPAESSFQQKPIIFSRFSVFVAQSLPQPPKKMLEIACVTYVKYR